MIFQPDVSTVKAKKICLHFNQKVYHKFTQNYNQETTCQVCHLSPVDVGHVLHHEPPQILVKVGETGEGPF